MDLAVGKALPDGQALSRVSPKEAKKGQVAIAPRFFIRGTFSIKHNGQDVLTLTKERGHRSFQGVDRIGVLRQEFQDQLLLSVVFYLVHSEGRMELHTYAVLLMYSQHSARALTA